MVSLVPSTVSQEVVVLVLSLVRNIVLLELVASVLARLLQVGRGAPSVSSVARRVTLQWTTLERSKRRVREGWDATTAGDQGMYRSSVLILPRERGVRHSS